MFGCDCFRIGGPWIGANPQCPRHGDAAVAEQTAREARISQLRARVNSAKNTRQLKALLLEILDAMEN